MLQPARPPLLPYSCRIPSTHSANPPPSPSFLFRKQWKNINPPPTRERGTRRRRQRARPSSATGTARLGLAGAATGFAGTLSSRRGRALHDTRRIGFGGADGNDREGGEGETSRDSGDTTRGDGGRRGGGGRKTRESAGPGMDPCWLTGRGSRDRTNERQKRQPRTGRATAPAMRQSLRYARTLLRTGCAHDDDGDDALTALDRSYSSSDLQPPPQNSPLPPRHLSSSNIIPLEVAHSSAGDSPPTPLSLPVNCSLFSFLAFLCSKRSGKKDPLAFAALCRPRCLYLLVFGCPLSVHARTRHSDGAGK